jgi:hypothetical protein
LIKFGRWRRWVEFLNLIKSCQHRALWMQPSTSKYLGQLQSKYLARLFNVRFGR